MIEFRRKREGLFGSWARLLALALLLAAALAILAPGSAKVTYAAARQSAHNDQAAARVFDQAELFSSQDKAMLEDLTAQCRKDTGMDVVILTAYNDHRHSATQYADDFYDNGGFGVGKKASGVLLLIYMDRPGSKSGDYWISTTGNMTRILTDQRVKEMGSQVVSYLKGQDYTGVAQVFLKDIKSYVDQGIVSGQYNYNTATGEISRHRSIRWYEALLAVVVSGIVALTACLGVKGQYAMKPSRRQEDNSLLAYRANAKCAMNVVQDTLVNQYVTHTRISTSSGGGGGGGHSSGSSAGCSSTHTSSSGGSHGGGGGRF